MSDTSVAPLPVNWEAVRALALVVGVREAARRMEISEETVKKRCTREGWLASDEAKAANRIAVNMRSGITMSPQMSPAALIQAELSQLGRKTKLSIARGIAKAGEHIESLDGAAIVEQSSDVKNIAQTADLVHGWKEQAPQVKIRLDVLSGNAERVVEVESEVVNDSWQETSVDPLDEY